MFLQRNFNFLKNKKAFTLAEVLITLGIIGIVATLTIPTLLQKQNEVVTVSALKKAYSNLSQAYTTAVQENGTPDTWGLSVGSAGNLVMMNVLTKYLSVAKNCGINSGCFPDVTYVYLNGNPYPGGSFNAGGTFATAELKDGSLLLFDQYGDCNMKIGTSLALQNYCGYVYFDINGFKSPNKYGVDWFQFFITKYGVVPGGSQLEDEALSSYSFYNDCRDQSAARGTSCAAWVIYNENMDYLHCSDLSWSGKHKCS